jgi:hypothetical protein
MTAGSPEGMSLPLAAQQQLLPKLEAAGNAATLLPPQSQPFADFKAAAAAAGIKVCENCGTTSTPLWRKDKQTGMMMCNVSGRRPNAHHAVVLACGVTFAAYGLACHVM